MYERLSWALPKLSRKPLKATAGWVLRACAACLRFSASAKHRVARLLGFRFRKIVAAFAAIPADQLARHVLFLSLKPQTRETRLAEAARFAGFEPILVYAGEIKYDPSVYYSFHAPVSGLLDLLLISWLFPGALIHVFSPDGAQAYLLCAAKTRRLILDLNDTCKSHALQSLPRVWEQCERDAIQAADGMTHRDLRVKYLHELYGYPLPRQNILIMDLLLEVLPPPRQTRDEGEIHVVSVGFVGKGDHSVLRIIKALCADRIHVHMYINPFQRDTDPDLSDYRTLRQESHCFHFEEPVFGDAYWERLSRYDFGLSACDTLAFGEKPTSCTMDSFRGAGSSRLMDYLLLGLGVIISPELKFQSLLARRYATVVVPVTREFLTKPRAALESALVKGKNAPKKSLSAITTRGVARRLAQFYERVAEAAGIQ
jgi:hypothetical protein